MPRTPPAVTRFAGRWRSPTASAWFWPCGRGTLVGPFNALGWIAVGLNLLLGAERALRARGDGRRVCGDPRPRTGPQIGLGVSRSQSLVSGCRIWWLQGGNSGRSRRVTAQSVHLRRSAAAARRAGPDRQGGTDMPRPATPTGRPRRTAVARTRMGLVPGLLLALSLAVAACGGGGKSDGVASLGGNDKATATTRASGDPKQKALTYARCMRQHGIDIPDPKIDAQGRMAQQLPAGVGPNDPKFKAADQACKQYAPGGGEPEKVDPHAQQQMLAFA